MYEGANPVSQVQMPKIDNQRTEFLTENELSRLMKTLENWPFKDSVAFVRFAMFTGLRRGELFKLILGRYRLRAKHGYAACAQGREDCNDTDL